MTIWFFREVVLNELLNSKTVDIYVESKNMESNF